MSATVLKLRLAVIWVLFGVAAILATAPVWRIALFGINPTLDDLLQLICLGR